MKKSFSIEWEWLKKCLKDPPKHLPQLPKKHIKDLPKPPLPPDLRELFRIKEEVPMLEQLRIVRKRREQWNTHVQFALQNREPSAVKVLHAKAIVTGLGDDEESLRKLMQMYWKLDLNPQYADRIYYRTAFIKVDFLAWLSSESQERHIQDHWNSQVEYYAYHTRDPSAVKVLHAKAIRVGLDGQEEPVRKLMEMYYNLALEPQVAGRIYYGFLPTPLSQAQLVNLIHWLFDHMGVTEVLHFTRMPMIVHGKIIVLGLHRIEEVVCRLMSLYSGVGSREYVLLFESLEDKGPSAWRNLLYAHTYIDPAKAPPAFSQMLEKTDIEPTARMIRAVSTAIARCDWDPRDVRNLIREKKKLLQAEVDVTIIGSLVHKTMKLYGLREAIETLDELMCGLSDHICGMVFSKCLGRRTPSESVDVEMALKMIDVVIRDGGSYKLHDHVYFGLVNAGVVLPAQIKAGGCIPRGLDKPIEGLRDKRMGSY